MINSIRVSDDGHDMERVCLFARACVYMCVCICVFVYLCICVCVLVCVWCRRKEQVCMGEGGIKQARRSLGGTSDPTRDTKNWVASREGGREGGSA